MFRIDVDKNPRVKQKLQALLGSKFDLGNLAVFEARANDSLPIGGAGGFLKESRMTREYLAQMSDNVAGGQYVPIIENHDQHGSLPIGRIFDAGVFENSDTSDEYDLHILFYVEADSKTATNIDAAIQVELSTGTTPKSAKCSSCGFDFLLNDDNRRRLYAGKNYTPLCSEGHQWGVGGNHLKLADLGKWKETSVVTRGAVTRAKILGEKEVKLSTSDVQINLSHGNEDDTLTLITTHGASNTGKPPENIPQFNGKNPMDITLSQADYDAFVVAKAKTDELKADLAAAKEAAVTHAADLKAAQEAQATAEGKLTTVEADLATEKEKAVQLQAQLDVALAGGGNKGKSGEGAGNDNPEVDLALDNSYFKQS